MNYIKFCLTLGVFFLLSAILESRAETVSTDNYCIASFYIDPSDKKSPKIYFLKINDQGTTIFAKAEARIDEYYRSFSAHESGDELWLICSPRIEYASSHGKLSFKDKGKTVAATLTKPDGGTLSAEIPVPFLPDQILEAADGTLWCRAAGSIIRITVGENALVVDQPTLPFYLPDFPKEKIQVFEDSIPAMIKSSDGKIGLIVSARQAVNYVFDRVFFFDPTENAWFEQTLDGEMHRYDNSMARKENEAYQKGIEER